MVHGKTDGKVGWFHQIITGALNSWMRYLNPDQKENLGAFFSECMILFLGTDEGLRCHWPCPIGFGERLERDALSRQYGLGWTRVEPLVGQDSSEITAAKRRGGKGGGVRISRGANMSDFV